MSRHNQIKKFPNIVNGVMSGTSMIPSVISSVQFLDNIGLQFVWSGSPVGNFSVLISADYDPVTNNAGNWIPIILTFWNGSGFTTSAQIPTGLGSPYYLDLSLLSAPWIQVQYTNISGSGTLNAFLTAKAI